MRWTFPFSNGIQFTYKRHATPLAYSRSLHIRTFGVLIYMFHVVFFTCVFDREFPRFYLHVGLPFIVLFDALTFHSIEKSEDYKSVNLQLIYLFFSINNIRTFSLQTFLNDREGGTTLGTSVYGVLFRPPPCTGVHVGDQSLRCKLWR